VRGATDQAAKHARRRCFAMLDFFGLNSVFLSTTPDDECSFRVRLYCKPHYWVSSGRIFQEDEEEGQEGEEDEKDDDEDEALNRLSYPTYIGIQYWQKSYSLGNSIF
jgi:hypothetical protein